MWGCAAAAPDYAALAAAVLEFEANCDAVGHRINSHKALAPMVGSRFYFACGFARTIYLHFDERALPTRPWAAIPDQTGLRIL
jgi:hypothetical protein